MVERVSRGRFVTRLFHFLKPNCIDDVRRRYDAKSFLTRRLFWIFVTSIDAAYASSSTFVSATSSRGAVVSVAP